MEGLIQRVKSKKKKFFQINKSIISLDAILNQCLPCEGECIKLISFDGGFSSISFISLVAQKENILELTASTLRIGEKQFIHLARLSQARKLHKATFFLSTLMKEDKKRINKYNYYGKFEEICKINKWERIVVNNHSKIILMRTQDNFYVIETSSNLNENPKIEQYSFENDKTLYSFYYGFFEKLKGR
jgi:hypothetical protein